MYKKNRLFELPEDLWEKGVDIVYIASQTCQISELVKLEGYVHYEERPLLSVIMRLKDPNIRVAYFSSVKIPDETLDYYFSLATGTSTDSSLSSLRDRFYYRYFGAETPEPLTSKILNSPSSIAELNQWLRKNQSYMYCVIPTDLENRLAELINSPLIANPYTLNYLGTKFGSRSVFAKANIPFPDGIEEVFTLDELIEGINRLWKKYPKHNNLVVKLNEGVSGVGNTIFHLSKIESQFVTYASQYLAQKQSKNQIENTNNIENNNNINSDDNDNDNNNSNINSNINSDNINSINIDQLLNELDDHLEEYRKQLIRDELEKGMDYVDDSETWQNFFEKIGEKGAIAELWIDHVEGLTSPSAQAEIRMYSKSVYCLSTHEQMLWKNSKYLGCSFPANSSYYLKIQEYCKRVGEVLALEGAKERFAVDFVAIPKKGSTRKVQRNGYCRNVSEISCTENEEKEDIAECENSSDDFDIFAIEINLRTGGTTHPYETVKLLIDGYYNSDDGFLYTPNHERRCYKASDNLLHENYRKLSITELIALLANSVYAWNEREKKGCLFYITGSLPVYGKVGFVAVGETVSDADRYFTGFIALLNQATGVVFI